MADINITLALVAVIVIAIVVGVRGRSIVDAWAKHAYDNKGDED